MKTSLNDLDSVVLCEREKGRKAVALTSNDMEIHGRKVLQQKPSLQGNAFQKRSV